MLSSAPRGPRGSSNGRGGGRGGGIQKRRGGAGPVRVDRDGDMVMDAIAEKGKSGKGRIESPKLQLSSRATGPGVRGGPMVSQKAQQAIIRGLSSGRQANLLDSRATSVSASLQVLGLKTSKAATKPDGGIEDLLSFLERKAHPSNPNRSVKINKSHMKGDFLIITASPDDIASIQKLDGFSFAGSTLQITPYEPPNRSGKKPLKSKEPSKDTFEIKEKIRGILASRYDGGNKLLNLSKLGNDEGLNALGMFDGKTTTSKIFPALMAVCDGLFETRQAKIEAISSVTLAGNGLLDVHEVQDLAKTFPDLKNLDLSNNSLSELKSLDAWKTKFRLLETLILTGNPIEARLSTDKDELMNRYPYLQNLNGVQVRTAEEAIAAVEAKKARLLPIPIAAPDFRDVAQVGENFIRQFLPSYDNDRKAILAQYYDNKSSFSLSINMVSPRDRKNTAPIPSWNPYTKHSRNLARFTNLPTRMSRQYRGLQAIQELWSSLPATRHPDLQTESSKYVIECHSLPGLADPTGQVAGGVDGLILTVHGEFEEPQPNPEKLDEKAFRSFSRTFILGPGLGNQPIRIVSDMVVLRAYSPLASPTITPIPPSPQCVPQVQQQTPEQQQQEMLAMQLVEKTQLTVHYAVLCLTETGWDLEKAYVAFMLNKDKLPADAFIA